ncbi:hypothetical protein AX14_009633 [Amanita brunnescens Koide BX004]|nr:hypothetical protein AX14_009633 [Amanita brunnescens Koide BX004]
MGDPSTLRLVPASSASIPIDWSRIPEATKKSLLNNWGHGWVDASEAQTSLPATVGDLAKMFDKSNAGGAWAARFYMKYLEQVWVILFMPGRRNSVLGCSPDVIWDDSGEESDYERSMIAKEIELAQEFDLMLTRVSREPIDLVCYASRFYGWNTSMLHEAFENAQYSEAILTHPISQPEHWAIVSKMFGGPFV